MEKLIGDLPKNNMLGNYENKSSSSNSKKGWDDDDVILVSYAQVRRNDLWRF